MTHPLKIEAIGDCELVMTRLFDAPPDLVFEANTDPALVKRWLGVQRGWELAVCEIDLRVGGKYRYVWRHPDKGEMGMGGVYREIARPHRLVSTELFDSPWYPGDAVNTVTFAAVSGSGGTAQTLMTATTRYATQQARDGVLKSPMEQGVVISYQQLDRVLTTLASV